MFVVVGMVIETKQSLFDRVKIIVMIVAPKTKDIVEMNKVVEEKRPSHIAETVICF